MKTKKEYPIEADNVDNKAALFFNFLKNLLKSTFVKKNNQKIPHRIKVDSVKKFYKNLKNLNDINIRRINNEAIEIDIIK